MDRTTEAIAHFIGVFHLNVDATRMRDSYDAFRAALEAPEETDDPSAFPVAVKTPFDLMDFAPGVGVSFPPTPLDPAPNLLAPPYFYASEFEGPRPPFVEFGDKIGSATFRAGPSIIVQTIPPPPPNTVVTVTLQTITMSDDDFLSFGRGASFTDPSVHAARLAELVGQAESLSPDIFSELELGAAIDPEIIADLIDATAAAFEAAAFETADMAATSDVAGAADVAGAEVAVFRGAEASGRVINGVRTDDEAPDFKENMPSLLRERAAEEEREAEAANEKSPFPSDRTDDAPHLKPGHHVETGGNLSVNEAVITTNWVDAELIAVLGDVAQLDVISQTNVLHDRDSVSGGLRLGEGPESKAVNAASIERVSSETEEEAGAVTPQIFPSSWRVEQIDGDVLSLNWLEQHVFATDADRVEVELSGAKTLISVGENVLSDFSSMLTLGFNYEMILVGGDFLTTNVVEQVNVLLDDDVATGSTDLVDRLETADNYLQNNASISYTGVDTISAMSESVRDVADKLAIDGAGAAGSVTDEFFVGHDNVSVLYITGDLIEQNVIRQHNYVGDSDQVFLALDEFVDQEMAKLNDAIAEMDETMEGVRDTLSEITLTTGSNALLNNVSIKDFGIDSKIMAAGEIYTDALIHQAELIDTDAAPDGVVMQGLASEAIAAFLADEAAQAQDAFDESFSTPPVLADSGDLDVMQSLLG